MVRNGSHFSTHASGEARIAEIARSQHGIFSRGQALDCGFTADQIRYRVRLGRWETVDASIFRPFGTPETWEQRLIAACLVGPAVASHRSAATMWSLPGFPRRAVEVSALRHRRRRPIDVIWHESFHLGPTEVTHLDGVPITRVHRTLIDLAGVVSSVDLEVAIDDALRRNLTSVARIQRGVEELGSHRRGGARLARVLKSRSELGANPESPLESRFVHLVRSAGLRLPVPQHSVRGPDAPIARVDFAYPDERIAIELDGAASHTNSIHRQRDLDRQNRLVLAGWRVVRFTWEDVTCRPDFVVATLRQVLSAAA